MKNELNPANFVSNLKKSVNQEIRRIEGLVKSAKKYYKKTGMIEALMSAKLECECSYLELFEEYRAYVKETNSILKNKTVIDKTKQKRLDELIEAKEFFRKRLNYFSRIEESMHRMMIF